MDNNNIDKINNQINDIFKMGDDEDNSSRQVIVDRLYSYDDLGDTKRIDSIKDISLSEENDIEKE